MGRKEFGKGISSCIFKCVAVLNTPFSCLLKPKIKHLLCFILSAQSADTLLVMAI